MCCVCGRDKKTSARRDSHSLLIKPNGKPCMHWTHLKYCTSVRWVKVVSEIVHSLKNILGQLAKGTV